MGNGTVTRFRCAKADNYHAVKKEKHRPIRSFVSLGTMATIFTSWPKKLQSIAFTGTAFEVMKNHYHEGTFIQVK